MTKCPKCGSIYISEPKYEGAYQCGTNKSGEDRLRYTCERCGYSMTTQTDDAKKEPSNG